MENQLTFELINGEFTHDEAKEIILHVLNFKINFHHTQNLSLKERFGDQPNRHTKRIDDLKKTKERILQYFNSTENKPIKLQLNSIVKLSEI